MHDRVAAHRPRAVAGRAVRNQTRAPGLLFGGLHHGVFYLPVLPPHAAAFGKGDLGVDIGPVLVHDVLNAGTRGGLLSRLREEDDVAVELYVVPLQQHHRHHRGHQVGLVIERAASVNPAAVARGAERWEGPL